MKGETIKKRLLELADELKKEEKNKANKELFEEIVRKVKKEIKNEDEKKDDEDDDEEENKSGSNFIKLSLLLGCCASVFAYEILMCPVHSISRPSPATLTNSRPSPTMFTNDTIEMLERNIRRPITHDFYEPSNKVKRYFNVTTGLMGLGTGLVISQLF